MKNDIQRKQIATFGLAALFMIGMPLRSPKVAFNEAAAFLAEAEARGIDVTKWDDADNPNQEIK